jgi:hypothetical protein
LGRNCWYYRLYLHHNEILLLDFLFSEISGNRVPDICVAETAAIGEIDFSPSLW